MKNFLIVVDMQKDFVNGALGTTEAQAIVDNVCRKILTFEGEIIVTFDTHSENYLETSEATGASSATISRVNRCLNYGSGYRTALDNLKKAGKLDDDGYDPEK